jgi:hypothetical protein
MLINNLMQNTGIRYQYFAEIPFLLVGLVEMTTVPMDFRGDPATLGQKESTSAGEQARRIVNKLQIVVGRYEEWVCQHSNFARHVETLLYIAPNLMPVHYL